MSRINFDEPMTLDELIPEYASNKSELDSYKRICDKENTEIKKQMERLNVNSYTAGNYTAKYIISTRETMDEAKLVEVIKKHGIRKIVKKVEVVDMEALEKYLYEHSISDELATDIDACREVKKVVQLRINKAKEK